MTKMRLPILLLLSLSTLNFTWGTEDTTIPRTESNDFLVRLLLNISESNVPRYIINMIFDQPAEKGVTTKNVFDLYHVGNLDLNSTIDILQAFNRDPSSVFSLDGLNHTLTSLNWTFTTFYNNYINALALTGPPLRNALLALQIDAVQFSAGLAWGEPDPWSEFIKGNFTMENLVTAAAAAEITIDKLFGGIINIITAELQNWNIQDFVNLCLSHSFGKPEALTLWSVLNISLEDVFNVEPFKSIIEITSERINNQSILGVLSEKNIFINKKAYDIFKSDRELLDIYAETVLSKTLLAVNGINDSVYEDIVVLKHDSTKNLTTIELGHVIVNQSLSNCSYVTIRDNSVESIYVEQVFFINNTLQFQQSVSELVLGSALICNNSIYGLAREITGETIVLDSFKAASTAPPQSSSSPSFSGSLNIFKFIAFCVVLKTISL